ncbi:hypothetical protein MTBBW1_440026 [Desulfamplus magnetovallimortis]|uniref:Uncharacterized protein n=1 Tax=Desulfamplus magnetovallimortis TaxID=1246637 RepID=A0A1W1HH37_9BACT|nr:hypothetical protein MTBBW1_440026 [Desulfamplus magnetovallimortis]
MIFRFSVQKGLLKKGQFLRMVLCRNFLNIVTHEQIKGKGNITYDYSGANREQNRYD